MARVESNVEYKTFVKGLITEATPLTFPENASLDENNFDLRRDGGRRRRLGLDYEQGFSITTPSSTLDSSDTWAFSSNLWEDANREGLSDIAVVQLGTKLWFFDANAESISTAPLNSGNPVDISGNPSVLIDTAAVYGKLLICNGQKGFIVLTYNEASDSITVESRLVLVRDIWGVDDGLVVTRRKKDLSGLHEYNLVNQGWGTERKGNELHYESLRQAGDVNAYPSNADVVSAGKDPTDGNDFKAFLVENEFFGSTPAPKGFSIVDTFRRGSSRKYIFEGDSLLTSHIHVVGDPFDITKFLTGSPVWPHTKRINSNASLLLDSSAGGIRTSAAFAGRAWFAGASSTVTGGDEESPNLGSYIFFSQVVDNDAKLGKCYQEGDPTSEDNFDPVATDGGAVRIPDASNIRKLVSVGRTLLVFAENGIWEISGGEQNFSATNIEVSKVTTVGALSPESILNVEGSVFYWAEAGIYVLSQDQITGRMSAQNITESAIQSFYNNISTSSKALTTSVFDPSVRKARWLYNDSPDVDGVSTKNKYNRELIFDVVLKAFYTASIHETEIDSPYVAGYLLSPVFNNLDIEELVVSNTEQVVISGEDVVIASTIRSSGKSRVKYFTIKPEVSPKFTFSLFRDEEFLDWKSDDGVGVDAPAFLLTGYESLQDSQRNKQAPYITCSFFRTESGFEQGAGGGLEALTPSSCLLQAQWNYADSPASGKFGTEQQVYRLKRNYIPVAPSSTFDYGESVVVTKSKLRGRGKALSLLFKTEPGKDLHIHGWGVQYTGSSDV